MQKAACPQCGAEVIFHSLASVYAVCKYCSSTIYKQGFDVRLLGKMAALQNDPTTFQIGTSGSYKGAGFDLIGRLRLKWSSGFWNEWYMFFGGERAGWLAEAQGSLMVTFETQLTINQELELRLHQTVQINGAPFTINDVKETTCVFSEGELPFSGEVGRVFTNYDLSGPAGKFATITTSDNGSQSSHIQCFVGEYVEPSNLRLVNLKRIDGW